MGRRGRGTGEQRGAREGGDRSEEHGKIIQENIDERKEARREERIEERQQGGGTRKDRGGGGRRRPNG